MRLLTGAIMVALWSIPTIVEASAEQKKQQDTNKNIDVIKVIALPAPIKEHPSPITAPPAADSADFLRQIPGISAGRFGGHSLEPVVRGQQQGQLSILNNGSFQMGSGPNRMDTPSTYAAVDLIDKVIVVKGYQSVLNGPGASGGFIQYERNIPTYDDNLWSKSLYGVGYEGNGNVKRTFGRTSVGKGGMAVEAWGSLQQADSYKDGNGNIVNSAFNDYALGGAVTFMNKEGNYLQAGYDWNKMTDALFPGAGMDSTLSGGNTFRLRGQMKVYSGFLEVIRLQSSYAKTKHYMDNFSFRPNMGMMQQSRTTSKAIYGEIEADVVIADMGWTLVADFRDTVNDGSRYTGMSPDMLDRTTTNLWPDIHTKIIGFGAERKHKFNESVTVTYGLRGDRTNVSFGRADETTTNMMMSMMPMSANMSYMNYYNLTATDVEENQLSGLVRGDWKVNDNWAFFSSISKSARTADATERGMSNIMVMNGMNRSWIGNPSLKPEKHYQMDFGGSYTTDGLDLTFTLFADRVKDFILRDSARGEVNGQAGVFVTAPLADVYRNISAQLLGFEITGDWQINEQFMLNFNAAFVQGTDKDRDAPLAQIPPLQGGVTAYWLQGNWTHSASLLYALKQTRVDLNPMTATGRDPRQTPGYAVVNLATKYRLSEMLDVHVGIKNLFDKNFADHLSRSNLLDATEVQVNEPGRNAYLKLIARF
ncbi:MAG: TonB-dependent receptor [Emcibacteraceae bacterium]|nr:TonB-dependent receptor [Emcibacteraceae bacterium]